MYSSLYPIIKHLHMLCAALTICLFVFRFGCMRLNLGIMRQKWIRIVPHLNDTCIFIFGVTLVLLTRQYPFTSGHLWLSEKLLLLLCYILLGMVALRRKPVRPSIRYVAFFLALACFGAIYYLAKTKAAFTF